MAEDPAAASSPTILLQDPSLGLPFAPDRNRFEPAPVDLIGRCPDLENDRYTQQLWVFAAAERDVNRYLVVAGYFLPRRAGDDPIANPVGTLLKLSPEGCTLIGPAAELFAMPEAYEDAVPAEIASALAEDAARRLLTGHGGASGLAAAMRESGTTVGALPQLLQIPLASIADLPR